MNKESARIIACGLLHDGINADKLSEKAKSEIRRALETLLALSFETPPPDLTYVGPNERARRIVSENHAGDVLIEAIAAEIGAAELLAIPHRSDPKAILANALALSSAEQFRLVFQIAENIGCQIQPKVPMKKCQCGRLATHFVVLLTLDGDPKGKQLMCDSFPDCRPKKSNG